MTDQAVAPYGGVADQIRALEAARDQLRAAFAVDYQTNWTPRQGLQITTKSGVLVGYVAHMRDVPDAIAAFESRRVVS